MEKAHGPGGVIFEALDFALHWILNFGERGFFGGFDDGGGRNDEGLLGRLVFWAKHDLALKPI